MPFLLISKPVHWLFGADDEEIEEDFSRKRDKNRRREKKLLSRRIPQGNIYSSFGDAIQILGLTPAPKLPGFSYLNVKNAKQLKDVITKSGPRIIYCTNVRLTPAQHVAASHAVKALPSWINRFAWDCSAKLPSGKTAYQRFGVDPATTIMIVQAHGKKAIGINEYLLTNPFYFTSKVTADAAYNIKHVYNVEAFNEQLSSMPDRGLLVLADGKRMSLYNANHTTEISRVVDANRLYSLTTWVINDGLYELNFNENDDAPKSEGFRIYCLIPDGDKHLLGFYNGEPFNKAMEAFMRSCSTVLKQNRDFKPIGALPKLANRPLKKKKQTFDSNDEVVEDLSPSGKDQDEVLEL
ncbi:hypothetical protein X943_001229 [Babesia divergens]|uniref:Uncharacterized protein n=1 Tax=Babesia divergens TaxID=32595 RepID=A0AAD9GAF5_BABDI|nr:hypothetical protein X943_001229 [Babesia divergens]